MSRIEDANIALVIDDDNYVCTIIARMLRESLLKPHMVSNGKDALKSFRELQPRLVVIDYHLPDLTGVQLLRSFREIDPYIHAVLVSSDASESNVRQAYSEGCKGFLAKPFNNNSLKRYIAPFLQALNGPAAGGYQPRFF